MHTTLRRLYNHLPTTEKLLMESEHLLCQVNDGCYTFHSGLLPPLRHGVPIRTHHAAK